MKKLILLLLFIPLVSFGQRDIIEVDYIINNDKSVSFNYKKNRPGSYFLILEFNSLNNTRANTFKRVINSPSGSLTKLKPTNQDEGIGFKYVEFQIMEFNDNRIAGSDALANNLTATFAYYAYMVLGFDYASFSPRGGDLFFQKAQNIVNNAPEGRGISGWRLFDGQRNRFILIDNLTKSGMEKIHEAIYTYYRDGVDQMSTKFDIGRDMVLNALITMQEVQEENTNTMVVPILMQGKYTEIVGIFENANKPMKKQLLNTLSAIDLTNLNKYKEKLE